MRLLVIVMGLFWATAGETETPMNAQTFDEYTRGKTLYFYNNGRAYGVEQYFPNQRVQWSFLDGKCNEGEWYQQGRFICFIYADNPNPQCWTFFEEQNGLRALFQDDPSQTELYETTDSDEDMMCLGPEVGV